MKTTPFEMVLIIRDKMKKVYMIFFLLFLLLSKNVCADGFDDVFDVNMKKSIEDTFEDSNIDIDALDLIDKLNSGDFNMDYKNFGEYIVNNAKVYFKDELGFGIGIFVLAVLSSMIENVNLSFSNNNHTKTVVSSVVVLGLVGVTGSIAEYSVKVIDNLILFINSLTPTLMTLLATSGKVITSGAIHPIMISVSSLITIIIKSLVVPLCLVSLILKITGSITEKNYLTNFGNQIQTLLKWLLGIIFTVYVGIISVTGVAAPKVDDITLKTAKYAAGSFIPYVGGMVSDSVDLILNCSAVVKNSVGIAGLVGIFMIALIPCVKIAIKVLVLNILTVSVSPVVNKNIIDSLNSISASVSFLFAMNIVVSIMYIISVTVIIFVGGA